MMAKPKRRIGLEILQGLKEIKRGEQARKAVLPTIVPRKPNKKAPKPAGLGAF